MLVGVRFPRAHAAGCSVAGAACVATWPTDWTRLRITLRRKLLRAHDPSWQRQPILEAMSRRDLLSSLQGEAY